MRLRVKIHIILLLVAVSFSCAATAQNGYIFNIKKLTVKNGLIHQEVNCVFQDSHGLMWMGTRFGLSRYDGYSFTSFTREKGDLGNNSIDNILEDDNGTLWLFSSQQRKRKELTTGIDLLNLSSNTVTPIQKQFPQLPFTLKSIRNYFASSTGEIFILAGERLWKYSRTTGFQTVPLAAGFTPLQMAGKNEYWGIIGGRYAKLSATGTPVLFQPVSSRDIPAQTGSTGNLLYLTHPPKTTAGFEWMGDPVTAQPRLQPPFTTLSPNKVHYDERQQILWVSYDRELFACDKNGQPLYHLANNGEESVNRVINHFFTDRAGITWVATQAGVLLLEARPEQFTRYLYQPVSSGSEKQRLYQCRGIYQYGDYLFINTYLGSFRINRLTGQTDSVAALTDSGKKLPNRFPLYKTPDGRLFSGASTLVELDVIRNRELRLFGGERKRIWSIYYHEKTGQFLVGTVFGLLVSTGKDSLAPFKGPNPFPELDTATILQIVADRQNQVWLVTNSGLYTYSAEKGITGHYHTNGQGRFYLPADNIQHLYADSSSTYWLATEGVGLVSWKPGGMYRVYNRTNGLSSNNIYAVYEDRRGYLWLSSDYGLMRLNRHSGQVILYTAEDGLSHYEFNRISHYQSPEGRLYFGSLNGVTAFDPEVLDAGSGFAEKTPVTVVALQQYNGRRGNLEDYTGKLLQNGRIVLQPGDKFFTLQLAAPEYMHSEKTIFFYKIEGLDKEWTRSADNNIRVGRLPYGRYTLAIKAQLANGNTTPETRIPILAIRPFYLRWWFLALAVLLLALAIRFFFLWRIRQLQKRKKELETTVAARTQELVKDKATIEKQAAELLQLDEMKSKFFANVSHELRTPLTLLAGPIHHLLQQSAETDKDHAYLRLMQQNVQQLQNRVNEILDLSKLDAGKLELKETPLLLEKMLQPVMASFESLAQQKNIHFLFRNRVPEKTWLYFDSEQLKKIVNNLLSNAMKFTPAGGQVLVTVTEQVGQIVFKVADTGEGIHPDEQQYIFNRFYQSKKSQQSIQGGTGIGLALTGELVALMKGRIVLESEPGKGSTFIVELPKKMAPATVPEITVEESSTPVRLTGSTLPAKGARLLLVEDNLSLQQYIQLELRDFRITIANNGAEALQELETAEPLPELIISDIMMPVMDGFTLLEKIKAHERFRQIPVIMLTARHDIHDRLNALRIGVDDYLVKPFITEELAARVNNLLERYAARHNRQWLQEEEEEPATPTEIAEPATPVSSAWLKNLETEILGCLDRRELFTLDALAEKIFISKRQLQRNIKTETGLTANSYIKEIRLHRARFYLETKTYTTLAEVSLAVGFNDPHYFSTLFTERYGRKPVDYLG